MSANSQLTVEQAIEELEDMDRQIISGKKPSFFKKVAHLLREADAKSPVKELKGTFPVVLYFATDADRAEFIEVVQAAKPNLVTKAL
jgi:hypothetical protein